ncbi:hypothetical protein GK047_24330 [Paenibacillus sp. SYP-B3998]|uniref:Copper amine oxidase-like N-terminal domain-containing protein n=1 Tax=Paenibacillus sp. SYP-B3998 TaxID=2678564 RepID=A0A6G4A638_9BACL|nr:WG repeat-containing protein [Paenibacillus sp. SYP-B3998]NEW09107.1 hypothetical protein [Paenibacillus sp. SYP-B3998]
MFKKLILYIVICVLVLQFGSVVYAEQKVEIKENGEVTIDYRTSLGDPKKYAQTATIIVKDGHPMIPLFTLERYYTVEKPDLILLTTEKNGAISVLDTRNETEYQMKVNSNKVKIVGTDHQKLGDATLSTTVSVHLEGDIPFIPIDFFQILGYSSSIDAGKKVQINLIQKSSGSTNSGGSSSGSVSPGTDASSNAQTLYPMKIGRKYGFMDQAGKVFIQPQFEGAGNFSEGLAAVQVKGSWGYIDPKGNTVITPQYDSASEFSNDNAIVSKKDKNGVKFGYINKRGKAVGSIMYESALDYKENFAPVVTGTHFAFLNRDGNIQFFDSFEDAGSFSEGLAKVQIKGKYGYINKKGEVAIPYQYTKALDFSGGMAAVSIQGKWGYIDKEEEQVIPAKYEDAAPFSEGLAAVQSGGKYGYIEPSGKTVIAMQYDFAGSFKMGYAPVKQLGKWGFIDQKGMIVVQPKYDFAYEANGALFRVQDGGQTIYLDHKGNPVKPLNENGQEINLVMVAGNVIEVNGVLLDLEVPPALVEGSTLVPLRAILESLNLKLDWNSQTKTINASKDGVNIVLQVDNPIATVNGKSVTLPVPPKVIQGNTLVPVRFISQSVGAQVDYAPYQPADIETSLFDGLDTAYVERMSAYGQATEHWVTVQGEDSADAAAAKAAIQVAAEGLIKIKDQMVHDIQQKYERKIDATPNDAELYMQYATVLAELGHLYEDRNLVVESEMVAAEAGKIDVKALQFYRLYTADLYGEEAAREKIYQEAANMDPFIVLNHAQKHGNYYDAGLAFSKNERTPDYAIFALKKAYLNGNDRMKAKAKQLLSAKYKIQL